MSVSAASSSLSAQSGYTVTVRDTTTGATFATSGAFSVSSSAPSGTILVSTPIHALPDNHVLFHLLRQI